MQMGPLVTVVELFLSLLVDKFRPFSEKITLETPTVPLLTLPIAAPLLSCDF